MLDSLRLPRYPASRRLRTAEEFARALKSGRRSDGGWVAAHVVAHPSGSARLGLAVTKRVAARAVDRNRVKRIVREAFRGVADRLGPVDVVIRLKRLPTASEWPHARVELQQLFARLAMQAGNP